jgi:hypothetical protein
VLQEELVVLVKLAEQVELEQLGELVELELVVLAV